MILMGNYKKLRSKIRKEVIPEVPTVHLNFGKLIFGESFHPIEAFL